MQRRLLITCAVALFATSAFAKDIYLSIGGSVGSFRTDTRIFNPSTTKDIQIQAYLLPINNVDNTNVQPKTITVPKRSMAAYDDVVSSLFGTTGLGGIRLNSSDDFVATQRVCSEPPALAGFVSSLRMISSRLSGCTRRPLTEARTASLSQVSISRTR